MDIEDCVIGTSFPIEGSMLGRGELDEGEVPWKKLMFIIYRTSN